jgi:catechol 2,3-dioxygenase
MAHPNVSHLGYGMPPSGHRLPDATRLGRVRLQVADLERSIAYYENVIGLRVARRSETTAALAPHGDDRVIVELHAKPGVKAVPRRGQIGLYHFAILLPTRASLGRFARHLAEIGERAGMSDHYVSEALYLYDPDGLGIEVYADRPRQTWRVERGQLAMASDPLDVASLVAEAGDAPWTGMPAGTTLGHVHLYVRDLDEGARFYHEGLGFDKIVWGYPGALFMSAGGYHHHLGTNTWAAGAPLATDDDARMLEWEIVVPSSSDVDDVAANLQRNAIAVERDGTHAVVRDPWGTQVRILGA